MVRIVIGSVVVAFVGLLVLLAASLAIPASRTEALLDECTPTDTPVPSATDTPTPTPTPTQPEAACTPTGTPTPTQVSSSLVVQGMSITLETGGSCAYTSTTLGVRVYVRNSGATAAGPFVVDVNGNQQSVPGLGAGQNLTLWFSGYNYSGFNTATIYDNGAVIHQLAQFVPIPTLPPTCTPTYTPTPTSTPTATPVAAYTLGGIVCRGLYDPNYCGYLFAVPIITLQPLGRQMATGYHGEFQFLGVPDGQYSLVLSPSCHPNPIDGMSCYAPLAVVISGTDAYVTWKPCPDGDCDGVPPASDNCPNAENANQLNADGGNAAASHAGADLLGDACDPDISGDGYGNATKTVLGKNLLVYCPIMRADVDGDGAVSILDLSKTAMKFGQTFPPTDPAAGIDMGIQRLNQDADAVISILDLTRMADVFAQRVSDCP